MKISICDADNEPVPLADYCPSNNAINEDLKNRLDNPHLFS
jgi:hypothetical protein